MIFKLLIEHHLEFLSLKGGCRGSSESTHQNATLLEISCTGSTALHMSRQAKFLNLKFELFSYTLVLFVLILYNPVNNFSILS